MYLVFVRGYAVINSYKLMSQCLLSVLEIRTLWCTIPFIHVQ